MAPGQKMGKRKSAEAPLCAYEKVRERTMLRNSMALQCLGVAAAASLLNSTCQMATKGKDSAPEDSSDSLFEPEDDEEDNEQVVVDKTMQVSTTLSKDSAINRSTPSGGLRLSKRVMVPHEQEQPARRTRQRTRELSVTEDGTTFDPLAVGTFFAEPENDIQSPNEDEPSRRINMGKGLDKLTRGMGTKIPVHIVEGKRRPEAPIQAAKLASKGGIILRQHITVLTHWKYYNKQPAHFTNYIGKVSKQDKYKDVPPTEIDLFKECHCSSKTGFAEHVRKVIADMEAIIAEAAPEGQAPKTPAEVVSQVMPKTTFLQMLALKQRVRRGAKLLLLLLHMYKNSRDSLMQKDM